MTNLPNANFDTLNPGEHCKKLMFYGFSRRGDAIVRPGRSEENKRDRKSEMLSVDQFFMFLVWLNNVLNLDFTSWLFDSSKTT